MPRRFWLLWCSQLINRFGDGFYTIPLGWVVYQVTGSAVALGGIVFIRMAVMTAVQFAASPIVDLRDRRKLMITLDLIRGVVSVYPFLLIQSPHFALWQLYVIAFWLSALGTPYRSSSTAMLPLIVPGASLAAANAWLQGGMQSMYAVGPALAGFFVARFGAAPAFLVDAATFLVSAAILMAVRSEETDRLARQASGRGDQKGYAQEILSGLRTLAQSRLLVMLTVLQSLMLFADSAFVLAIPYVRLVLHGTAAGVGMLEGSLSAGMILISALSVHPLWQRRPQLTLLSVPIFGVASAALGWTDRLSVAVLLQCLAGLAYGLFTVRTQLLIQTLVPDELLGRTLMLRNSLGIGAQAVGVAIASFIGQSAGIAPAFELIGLGSGLAAALTIARSRRQAIWPSQAAG